MKKRILSLLAALALCVAALFPQTAYAAGCSLSGATSLRAGDSVTLTFSVSGSGILYVEGLLEYDSATLELTGTRQLIGGSWSMDQNGSTVILNDTKLSAPINSSTKLFSATFRVKSGVSAGKSVWAKVSGVSVSDGNSDTALGSASWSATIKAPLSSDANLDDLWCDEGELDFDGGSEYRLTVPYSVSSLHLDWDRSHSGASVSVSGNSLSVGSNTVTVTVKAENGNTKRYYIYVTREQDPNYVPSSDTALSDLQVSTGTLSPAFDPEITDYVVYVPHEVLRLSLTGTARDSKAKSVRQLGGSSLTLSMETVLLMRCTAEDNTYQDYKVRVIRMPAYGGTLPQIIPPVTEPLPEPEPEPQPLAVIPALVTLPYVGEVATTQALLYGAIALGVLAALLLLLVWLLGRRSGRKKALRQMARQTAEEPALLERLAAADAAAPAPEKADPDREDPPAEQEAQAEEVAPLPEETPAQEEASAEAPAEETPAAQEAAAPESLQAEESPAKEEAVPAQVAPAAPPEEEPQIPRSDKPLEELDGMSLDELLEDIRRM